MQSSLAAVSKGARAAKLEEVESWLRDFLTSGAKSSAEATEAAKQVGYSWRVLKNARDAIGVIPYREGFGSEGTWYWRLPAIENQE
jgi:hypothetical protein